MKENREMKTHKYLTVEKQKILIDGAEQEVTCYGGSNISEEFILSRYFPGISF